MKYLSRYILYWYLIKLKRDKNEISKDSIIFQQLCKRLGHQIEQEIVHIIEDCPQLLRLGLSLEFREPLNKVATILQRNWSNHKHQFSTDISSK